MATIIGRPYDVFISYLARALPTANQNGKVNHTDDGKILGHLKYDFGDEFLAGVFGREDVRFLSFNPGKPEGGGVVGVRFGFAYLSEHLRQRIAQRDLSFGIGGSWSYETVSKSDLPSQLVSGEDMQNIPREVLERLVSEERIRKVVDVSSANGMVFMFDLK